MIYLLIDFLMRKPDVANSPIYKAVNTLASRTRQGGVEAVPVYDTKPENQVNWSPPYVRLYDTGVRRSQQPGLRTNGQQTTSVWHQMIIECYSMGNDQFEAEDRASNLQFAVFNRLNVVKADGVNLAMYDDSGTLSYRKIQNIEIVEPGDDPLSGPGQTNQTEELTWTACKTLAVMVQVDSNFTKQTP